MSFDILLVSKKLKGDINNLLALGLHPLVLVVCCLLGEKEDKGNTVYWVVVFAFSNIVMLTKDASF